MRGREEGESGSKGEPPRGTKYERGDGGNDKDAKPPGLGDDVRLTGFGLSPIRRARRTHASPFRSTGC